jgi:gamma-glutamyltranspeptidase / glutathione hydrolase
MSHPLPPGGVRRRRLARALLPLALPLTLLPALGATPAPPPTASVLQEGRQRFQPVWSAGGIVASQEQLASAVGARVLAAGGNAVDAAVAASFALAVTLPQAGNLGGGGFLVLWLPGTSPARDREGCDAAPAAERRVGGGTAVAVNFRETAPLAIRPELFLNPEGSVDRRLATRSLLSTGVPGTPAGLLLAQRCYGRLPRQAVLAPAIALAEQGFAVGKELADSLALAAPLLRADPTASALFLQPPRQPQQQPAGPPQPYRPGEILRQPQLAGTLRRLAAEGEAGFYSGPVAEQLVALMRRGDGLIRQADLDLYRAQLVPPLQGSFRGHGVLTMPPPSGGGVTLLMLLALLEPMPLEQLGQGSAAAVHRLAEAMNLAYRDRNRWLGDPDQIAMPLERLLSRAYLDQLRQAIRLDQHRPAAELDPARVPPRREGPNTTHLSVADREGGLVATTTTLNFAYGNGIAVPGAGFLLNNEIDDFTLKPGVANAYGLVQGEANRVAPGRRPLSSMTPTLVFRPDGSPWLATGSPGGSRIITTVLQVLLGRMVHGLNLAGAVAAPRMHSQLWPDRLLLEEGFSADTRRLLEAKGHSLTTGPAMGSANSVEVLEGGGSLGVADPRRRDAAAVPEGLQEGRP